MSPEIVVIAARGPDEDRYRLHVEEPDASGAFMCGLPSEGTKFRAPDSLDEECQVCQFLASPMGLYAASEGERILAADEWATIDAELAEGAGDD